MLSLDAVKRRIISPVYIRVHTGHGDGHDPVTSESKSSKVFSSECRNTLDAEPVSSFGHLCTRLTDRFVSLRDQSDRLDWNQMSRQSDVCSEVVKLQSVMVVPRRICGDLSFFFFFCVFTDIRVMRRAPCVVNGDVRWAKLKCRKYAEKVIESPCRH